MTPTRAEFEKAFTMFRGSKPSESRTDCHISALWAAQYMAERCAGIANRYMADCKDPAKSVAASDIKIMIRQFAKDLSNDQTQ